MSEVKFKDYPKFDPEYKGLKFSTKREFEAWLIEHSYARIELKDNGQDLLWLIIDAGGEVLHSSAQGFVWNGMIVATDRLRKGKFLWWSDSNSQSDKETDFLVEAIEAA